MSSIRPSALSQENVPTLPERRRTRGWDSAARDTSLPQVGQLVAEKYRIEGQLGEGGMAVVFAAHHTLLDKSVAIKVLSPDLAHTPELVQRFMTEARAAARVDSLYVARVIDVGTFDDGLLYIVMERLEGCSLEELLAVDGQLPITDAVDYVLQALQGLAHAHVLGVIHRDLKPDNLFLARQSDGSTLVKILDFGIAKLVDEAGLIARGRTVGCPLYMSPEQLRNAELVDPRADIWSIGVVLYELLTGKTPFDAGSLQDTVHAVLEKTPEPMRTLRSTIPDGLDATVLRCLHREPEERFADVGELAAAISNFGSGECASLVEMIELTLRQATRKFPSDRVPRDSSAPKTLALVPAVENGELPSFLYGDSEPAAAQPNFLAFLEDALDVMAKLLVFDDQIARLRDDIDRLPREADEEIGRITRILEATRTAITHAPKKGPDTPSGRVAISTLEHLHDCVATEEATILRALEARLAAIPRMDRAARDGCTTAFEELLVRHDMPGSAVTFELHRTTDDRYANRFSSVVDFGLRASFDLEIPQTHPLSRVARLEKLARIEVEAPEMTGWIRKEVKLRTQRLDRLYIRDLTLSATQLALTLCANANGEGAGFHVELDILAWTFQLTRLGETDPPYDLDETDSAKLLELHKELFAVAQSLAQSRSRVLEVSLDGAPLFDDRDPREIVERLVRAVAPITREIAVHSPTARELALKRTTAGNTREEVFVPRARLLAKLESVPESVRWLITPLVFAIEETALPSSPPNAPQRVSGERLAAAAASSPDLERRRA